MAKLTNLRERIHQPWKDSLIRTAGAGFGANMSPVADNNDLFTGARPEGFTNLRGNGGQLPSDNSFVTLALKVHLWFRAPVLRGGTTTLADGVTTILARNGDYAMPGAAASPAFAAALNGQAIANYNDVHRNYWMASEAIFWTFGAGEKNSIRGLPSYYFAAGGGLHGDIGGVTDIVLWNNGNPAPEKILRLARAVLIPPRQNIAVSAQIVSYDTGGNNALFQMTQGARNMMSLRDNLNATDLMEKEISFIFDGIHSRDVQ